jgi:hypothetical protein
LQYIGAAESAAGNGGGLGCIIARFRETEMTDADLNFLVRQNDRILIEVTSLRDDMAVLTAMVVRLDGSHAALLQETRATHAQITRMNDRSKLEGAP